MNQTVSRTLTILCLFFLTTCLMSCGGGDGRVNDTGTLKLRLTDLSTDQFQAIYVTIGTVQVHKAANPNDESGWQTILTPHQTFNLLELVNGVFASLGSATLDVGSYDQLQLILDNRPDDSPNILGAKHPFANYFIGQFGNAVELKVLRTGMIVSRFDIAAFQTTELILDFDAARSVVMPGKFPKEWLLKPTAKILETVDNLISGRVAQQDIDGAFPLENSLVSAQLYSAADDSFVVQGATLTDADGMYKIFLPPATYNVVAVANGFEAQRAEVAALDFQEYRQGFPLVLADGSGTVSGTVTGLASAEDSATLSVRQLINCGSGEVPVQVDSINVANGGAFQMTLPQGDYTIVATAAGQTPLVFPVTVSIGQDTPQAINF
jgi:hypothetical protein